jgi:two-component sensor histidine kinase
MLGDAEFEEVIGRIQKMILANPVASDGLQAHMLQFKELAQKLTESLQEDLSSI